MLESSSFCMNEVKFKLKFKTLWIQKSLGRSLPPMTMISFNLLAPAFLYYKILLKNYFSKPSPPLPTLSPPSLSPWYLRKLWTFTHKLYSKTSLICTTLISFPEISWHIKSLLTTSTRLYRSSIPFQNFKVNKMKLNFHGKQLEIGIEGKKENDIAIMITAHALHNKTPHIVYSFFLWVFNLFCVEVLHIILCLLLEPPEKLLLLKFQSVWFDLVEPTRTRTILNSRCKSFRSGRFWSQAVAVTWRCCLY